MSAHTLVFYHYYEAGAEYASNLRYFLDLAIHPDVDYAILISGGCSFALPIANNIRYLHTRNQGLDFGAYSVGLRAVDTDKYSNFLFINCTTRGPFLLDQDCSNWTELFTSRLSRNVKLVGTTVNILPGGNDNADRYALVSGRAPPFPHVQTMAFAIDRACLALLLKHDFFSDVPEEKIDVISRFEIHLSQLVLANGWNIACLAPDYRGIDFRIVTADVNPTSWSGDPWFAGAYFGRSLHPYETIFFKCNRGVRSAEEIDSLSRSQLARRPRTDAVAPVELALTNIPTAWSGHKPFALWLVDRIRPGVVVDLGVDFGFSTFCFASAGHGDVYGIDSFHGDEHAGFRDTYETVTRTAAELRLSNVHIVKGFFSEVAATWSKTVDLLHVDGRHDYESVREDHLAWSGFLRRGGTVLFHDTCVPSFGVRRYFDEIAAPKINFRHSAGLGVMSEDRDLIAEIADLFSSLVEPGSLRL